jgi:DNA-binding transcriptional MocR family regulator
MTPAEERQFIRLWQAEASYRDLAQALGCALGTVGSRAAALVVQGKIQPRPRGGAYPRRKALARQEGTPPAPTRDPPAVHTREAPAITFMAVPEVRELISTVKELSARVAALENGTRGTTRDPPASGTHPRVNIKQWTVRLSQPLIDAVKAQATTEGKEPSHLVEELLWQALTDQRPSTS